MSLANADSEGNYITEMSDADFETRYNEMGKRSNPRKIYNSNIGGVTANKKSIYNRSSVANDQTRAHEIGHTLGENDSFNQIGVMAYKESFSSMSGVISSNGRRILKRDYKNNKKNNFNSPITTTNGVTTIHIQGSYGVGNFMKAKRFKMQKK